MISQYSSSQYSSSQYSSIRLNNECRLIISIFDRDIFRNSNNSRDRDRDNRWIMILNSNRCKRDRMNKIRKWLENRMR